MESRLTKKNEQKAMDFERPSMPAPQMGINPNQMMTPAAAREIATVQAQMVVAKCYPRDLSQVYYKIEQICAGEKLAKESTYLYGRGGASITGPSIRLAEAVSRAYGNMKYGFVEEDSNESESTVRAYAFDMETNTLAERSFTVPHVRYTKNGGVEKLIDPRDIYEVVANNASRRVRACILEIVPGDVIDYALAICQKTLASHVDKKPETMAALLKGFAKYNISKAEIEAFIQRKFEAIADSQIIRLGEIFQSLKDGIAKKEDFFKGDVTIETIEGEAEIANQEPVAEPEAETEEAF